MYLTTQPQDTHSMKPELSSYDYYIVAYSGGKDSTACYLHLIDQGIPPSRIEVWHQDIDGREGSKLMDWPCTRDYCRAFAEAFGSPIYYQWKVGGFEREMLRAGSKTAPTKFETIDGEVRQVGGNRGKDGTRLKFPQVSGDLSVRWCSSYCKIDVAATAIRNQARFNDKRTLVLSGERGEESPNRAKYSTFEPDKADNRNGKRVVRHVDRWRPVLHWNEEEVWAIIERYRVRVHPAYYMGWGRVSCATCIFGNANQWASIYEVNPEQVEKVSEYEDSFGVTIKRKETVVDLVVKGSPYKDITAELKQAAVSDKYYLTIIMNENETWELPAGAFGESCGPI